MAQNFLNRALIGRSDARPHLVTPALVLELNAFERNILEMARRTRAAGRKLRPHVKGPKCPEVARRQIAAGACGIACATLFEAETMVDEGIGPVLLTSPILGAARLERLMALDARTDGGVCAVVDSIEGVKSISAAARKFGRKPGVLVDINVGQKRTGVQSLAAAMELTELIARDRTLSFRGLQAYYGHLQGVARHEERRASCEAASAYVADIVDAMTRAGLAPEIVSGGGTGTTAIDLDAGVFTEIQPGSYPFMDSAYDKVDIEGGAPVFEPALFVEAEIVSLNISAQATLNAGMKAVPVDGAPVRVVAGAPADSVFQITGDEFGVIRWRGEGPTPALGDRVRLMTGHCDTTCNLHADLHVLDGDKLVDIWPISARGRW